ncbi:MAG: MFS transporter [Candidatus Hydrogenedentes bacterium]|nr:MFS transporter [Candidatus Hydrogenedentota bacterium]
MSRKAIPAPGHLSEQDAKSVLRIVFLTVFLDMAGFSIIFPLYPKMLEYYLAHEGNVGLLGGVVRALEAFSHAVGADADTGLVVLFGGFLGSLYALLQFICAPIMGSLSDRFGRRPVLLVSIAGLAISYALWFVAGSFTVLVVARFIGGLMSGNISTASAVIADVTPDARRSRGMAVLGLAVGIGFMFGPALGGMLAGIDLSAKWPSLAAYGVNPYSMAAFAAFVLATVNWVAVLLKLHETRKVHSGASVAARRPVNPLALFQTTDYPGVTRTNIIYFLYLLAFSGMEFSLTFLAADRFDYGPKQIMVMFLFIGIILALMQGTYVRTRSGVIGPRRMGFHGLLLGVPGLAIVGFAPNPWVFYLGLLVMALGSAQVRPCLSALVSLYSPVREQGRILGVFRSLESLARAIGPLVACVLYWRLGSSMAYYIAAAIMTLPVVLSRALPEPTGQVAEEPA